MVEYIKRQAGKLILAAYTDKFGFVVIVVVCLLIIKMRRSWFGMALASINNDSAAARSFGIDVSRYQILTFIIGTVIAGLAGGIYEGVFKAR